MLGQRCLFLPLPLHPPSYYSACPLSTAIQSSLVPFSLLPSTGRRAVIAFSSGSCARAMGTTDVECAIAPPNATSKQVNGKALDGIVKSPSDPREYEVIRLPNGLSAILVHDPRISETQSDEDEEDEGGNGDDCDEFEDEENYDDDDEAEDEDVAENHEGMSAVRHCKTCMEHGVCDEHNHDDGPSAVGSRHTGTDRSSRKMAAAALVVGVGSFSDPEDAQGLAHFLEHMLFMGCSKFPDENDYDRFLSKHGGSSNAYTDTEHTCFHFDVNHKFLRPVLDRFSQFFISPLVKEEALEREIRAVDSEFEQHLQSDAVRLSQLQCDTAYKRHPFNCFSWGNRKSLMEQRIDIRNKLLKLYDDYYLAGRMKLAVIGGEPLKTLKEWVMEFFSEVRPGGEKPLCFPWEGDVWEPGKLYRIKSVKDQHFVSITWPFPCLHDAYKKKPYDYISHLIGHEGAGSLLSLLKSNGWATNLSAGIDDSGFDRCSAGYMFNVLIFLTDNGLAKVKEVISLLYQYLKMLRSMEPQEWVFKELQAMTNMEFKFVEEDHPDDYAVSLATNMYLYPEDHIIYGDYALEVWDPELVNDLLGRMVPINMRLDIVTKSLDDGAGIQHEPWFGAPFTVETIPLELLEQWANPPSVNPLLHMPVVNEFIPTNFSLCDEMLISDSPRLLLDDHALRLWYKLDTKFKMPRANAYFLISCRGAYDSAKTAVMTELYVKLVRDALNETLYLASVARLETSLTVAIDKLEIRIHGFNEKLHLLASKIAQQMKNFTPSANRFEVLKEELMRGYANTNMKPSKHATYLRMKILRERFCSVEDKLEALYSLSLDDLVSFAPSLLSQCHIEAFCHGNLLENEAVGIAGIFKEHLVMKPFPNEPRERILKLPLGVSLVYNADAKNNMEENSAVEMYFQLQQDVGEETVRAKAIYDLFESIVSEPCFNELRTKQQLGYSVGCGARMTHRILGFCFRVLSAKFSPSFLKQRIDTFVDSLDSFLEGIDDIEYKSYVDALVEAKLESDHSLVEETDRHWVQIVERRYLFNINEREARELHSISKQDLIDWYQSYFQKDAPNLRKLTIFVWGANTHAYREHNESDEEVKVIDDIGSFLSEHEYYTPML